MLKVSTQILLVFLLVTPSAAFGFIKTAASSLVSVKVQTKNLLSQKTIDENGCGPTALLYSLKFGNTELRKSYGTLAGHTDEQKLKNLLKVYGAKRSLTSFHFNRFDSHEGMFPQDLLAMARDVTLKAPTLLTGQSLERHQGEIEPGSFVRRIHEALLHSLSKEVPVIAMILPYTGDYKKNKDLSEWSEEIGHYVVITGVPSKFNSESLGFVAEYLDPASGQQQQAYVYEEVVREFWGKKENADGSGEWIHPTVKHEGQSVSSPFLSVTAPQLSLLPENLKPAQRMVLTLSDMIGSF